MNRTPDKNEILSLFLPLKRLYHFLEILSPVFPLLVLSYLILSEKGESHKEDDESHKEV